MSKMDVPAIIEPNITIVVFEKFCFHLKNLCSINFLNVIAELEALLVGLLLIIGWPNILNLLAFLGLNHMRFVINFSFGI